MENIITYIFEKLQLKSNKIADKLYVNTVDKLSKHINQSTIIKFNKYLKRDTIQNQAQYIQQFAKFMSHNSNINIKQLAETYDIDELMKCWWSAVVLKMDNAIIEFADAIEKLNTITQDELHQYVIHFYKFPESVIKAYGERLNADINDVCRHYFELYDLKY